MSQDNNRIKMSMLNARSSIFFYFVMLVVNLFARKIFIEKLGDTLTGLTTTMQFTVGLLNIADIGIVTAISCALFKPISDNDRAEIQRIISLFCYLFRYVGGAIVIVGSLLILFLPQIVKQEIPLAVAVVSFLTFLFTTSLSYFVNYKQQLLLANQKTYVVTEIQNLTLLVKIALQIGIVYYFQQNSYYYWLAAEVVFAIIYSLLIVRRVSREYPWLQPSFSQGKSVRREYDSIFKNLKQIVSHKVAGVALTQTDSIIIATFISLSTVTYYYNYTMIISKLLTFVMSLFSGSWAGVGNLISESSREKVIHVFNQYNALVLYVGGVLTICVYSLADSFILCWLGEGYILGGEVFLFMVVSLYVSLLRVPLSVFLNGYSLYSDTWSAWVEVSLNLVISIFFSIKYGLLGVVLGTAISTTVIALFWKPYYLFKEGFLQKVLVYYKEFAKFVIPLVLFTVVLKLYAEPIIKEMSHTLFDFILVAAIVTLCVGVLYGVVTYVLSSSLRSIVAVLVAKLLKRRV